MALVVKNPTANAENLGDMASIPEQELPLEEGIFLPGESHGQRSLGG